MEFHVCVAFFRMYVHIINRLLSWKTLSNRCWVFNIYYDRVLRKAACINHCLLKIFNGMHLRIFDGDNNFD